MVRRVAVFTTPQLAARRPGAWAKFLKTLRAKNCTLVAHFDQALASDEVLQRWVEANVAQGVRDFIAVGGDGTAHCLFNALEVCLQARQELALNFGQYPLGSSNDFVKDPHGRKRARLDFHRASSMTVGELQFDGQIRYFIVGASLGLTALGNALFNHGQRRVWTPLAIAIAAAKSFFSFRNVPVNLSLGDHSEDVQLSNIGFSRQRFFAGSFRYPLPEVLPEHSLGVWLSVSLNRWRIMGNMLRFLRGSFRCDQHNKFVWSEAVRLRGCDPLLVEADGEVFKARDVRVASRQSRVRVCPID